MTDQTPPDLVQLRQDIDRVDSELVALLARRQKLVERVVLVKKREGIPALIPSRIDEVLGQVSSQAEAAGLSPELARLLWQTMINWFVGMEERQLSGSGAAD